MSTKRAQGESATREPRNANGEGYVSKKLRKDGRYVASYTYNGKRKYFYGKVRAELKKKMVKILHDIETNSYTEDQNLTFGQWLDEWLQTYAKPGIRISTYNSYELAIRGHIKPALGKFKLQNLKPHQLKKFLNERQENGRLDGKGGLSPKTIKNIYNVIRKALQQAYMNDMVHKNIADLVTKPKLDKKEVDPLTIPQQKQLEDTCKDYRLGVGIILTLYSGVRLGELLGLMWQDVDLEGRRITIRQTLNRLTVHDDPNRKTAIVIGKPKTAKGQREIPLQDFLIPLLRQLKKRQQEERMQFGQEYLNKGFVICNEQGNHIEPRTYQDFFKKMLREAGIPKTNFHTLRHTFATRALETGFDVKVLADILGHADASTTLNKYAHALPDHKRSSMDKLTSLWETST